MDDLQPLLERLARVEQELGETKQKLAEAHAQIAELEAELARRGKNYRPKSNRQPTKSAEDRRTKPHRKHPGTFREPPQPKPEEIIHHDVRPESCPHCGGRELEPTGAFDDHMQVDIPEPKLEYHRFRRHVMHCQHCGQDSQARGEGELPGGHIGPRARLLVGYSRSFLGISLGKTCDLLRELFGLELSRAGALGHIAWGGKLFSPVVQSLLTILRESPVVHADETGWRIDGKNVWAWCFCNPRLAVFLIRKSRSAEVIKEALGESLAGVLITDFYAAYNKIKAAKQKCLVHMLRELHELREKLPTRCVSHHIQPLIVLFQDAVALGKRRDELTADAYTQACEQIYIRYGECVAKGTNNKDVRRIQKRLEKYVDDMFTFLERPGVPADNNGGERDIRSVAAARADGGVNRTDWGATAFANIKSVIRTCQKNTLPFINYGLGLLSAAIRGRPLPLPCPDG